MKKEEHFIPVAIQGWLKQIRVRLWTGRTTPAIDHVLLWPLDATVIIWTDACGGKRPGIGGYNQTTGEAFRMQLPDELAFTNINLLEWLAAAVAITRWGFIGCRLFANIDNTTVIKTLYFTATIFSTGEME